MTEITASTEDTTEQTKVDASADKAHAAVNIGQGPQAPVGIEPSPVAILDYDRLRAWFLATLRKRIIKQIEAEQLSPAALIAADRKAVEKLILEKAEQPQMSQNISARSRFSLTAVSIACIVTIIVFEILLVVWISSQASAGNSLSGSYYLEIALACLPAPLIVAQLLKFGMREPIARLSTYGKHKRENETSELPRNELHALESDLMDLNAELSQATRRENAIVDYALEFIFAVDSHGRFTAVSPSSVDFLGYAWHELLGREIQQFVFSDDIDRVASFLSAAPGAKGTLPFECRLKRKDGSFVDVQWLAEWSQTEEMVFCIGKDISSQRQLDRMKKEFVSMIGHDLRTPLTSIACCLEFLQEATALSDESLKQVENASESTSRVLKLINELLDLEKLEAGKLPMNSARTALSGVVQKSLASVSSYAKLKNVALESRGADLAVMGDEGRLVQVLVNLLSNAIKFSPPQTTVTLSIFREGNKAVVSVADQGPGIPDQYKDIIFERFQQVKSEHSSSGSGLGLSICRAIIFAHGGTISAENNPNRQGSVFSFKVNLARDSDMTSCTN